MTGVTECESDKSKHNKWETFLSQGHTNNIHASKEFSDTNWMWWGLAVWNNGTLLCLAWIFDRLNIHRLCSFIFLYVLTDPEFQLRRGWLRLIWVIIIIISYYCCCYFFVVVFFQASTFFIYFQSGLVQKIGTDKVAAAVDKVKSKMEEENFATTERNVFSSSDPLALLFRLNREERWGGHNRLLQQQVIISTPSPL